MQLAREKLNAEIREANLSYLLLAQNMIRLDRAEALYRLGINDDTAKLIESLTTSQIVKIASSNRLLCRLRFGDDLVWNLITSHSRDAEISGMHAAIVVAGREAEAL